MRLNFFPPCQRGATPLRRGSAWRRVPWRRGMQAIAAALFLYLFFYVCWPYGAHHQADALRAREAVEAEAFLALDPLTALSTALAAKMYVWSLPWAAAVLLAGLVLPRVFCGFLCPMGTLLDATDRIFRRRTPRPRPPRRGRWVHLRFYLLAVVLAAAALGVLLAGFFAPIPVLTRSLLFTLEPLQLALLRGTHLLPPWSAGQWLGVAMFLAILLLGFLAPRFWCRYLCPSGALLSLTAPWSVVQRRINARCTGCGKCAAACPLGAIRDDFQTRPADCVSCQTCGAVCPEQAIDFEVRLARLRRQPTVAPAPAAGAATAEPVMTRRGFLVALGCAGTAAVAIPRLPAPASAPRAAPVRAPGSVPEAEFLRLCVRCGECIKACPFHVLQAATLEDGLDGLWAPRVKADWAGCDPSCNCCGQVCPTGAIRALPLAEKRAARMGLAIVNRRTCLPCAGRGECRLCVDECKAAGYDAIEVERQGVEVDDKGEPVEGSGVAIPVVVANRCVGCGLCQMRCHAIQVKSRGVLRESAIVVVAGPGREDRLRSGSYRALRRRTEITPGTPAGNDSKTGGDYLPDFMR